MKGDYTRETFRKEKHYATVRMQQGRVQVDADWNEQGRIELHRDETTARDLVGPCGVPAEGGGFEIGEAGGKLTISAGHLYVDGILCENETDLADYNQQPDLPDPLPNGHDFLPSAKASEGKYFVYLDVWRRHVTALDDPDIRDVALGGTDTGTRLKTLWQVKLLKVAKSNSNLHCLSDPANWKTATAIPSGTLAAKEDPASTEEGPCVIPATAGYRRLENQLYRVEVHQGGASLSSATFKWSRDNGFVAAKLLVADSGGTTLAYQSSRSDATFGFSAGQWLELTDEAHELMGVPGDLFRVQSTGDGTLTVADPDGTLGNALSALGNNPRIRRWDGLLKGSVAWRELEDGVQVSFVDGSFRSGDYWMIPARTSAPHLGWPTDGTNPVFELPHGIDHHYCKLAVASFTTTDKWKILHDCREKFPAATALEALFYLGGDGQEAKAGETLPLPLRVGVSNGSSPVEGANIEWKVLSGGGSLSGVENSTDAHGVATCRWKIGSDPDKPQEVSATFRDAGGATVHLPIRFHAAIETATGLESEEGVKIKGVFTSDSDGVETPLLNDTVVDAARLGKAGSRIRIKCDRNLWPASFGRAPGREQPNAGNETLYPPKPTCFLTLYLPCRANSISQFLGVDHSLPNADGVFGFFPLVLNGEARVENDFPSEIWWDLPKGLGETLNDLVTTLREIHSMEHGRRILVKLSLAGNFIWESTEQKMPSLYLDGEAFGIPRPGRDDRPDTVDLAFPGGNDRKGGAFEMWFWLTSEPKEDWTRARGEIKFVSLPPNNDLVIADVISGILLFNGKPINDVDVRLAPAGGLSPVGTVIRPKVTKTATAGGNDGVFKFGNVQKGSYQISATVEGVSANTQVAVQGTGPVNPNLSLTDVPNITRERARILALNNIRSVQELAAADVRLIRELLSLGLVEARNMIRDAKALIEGG